MIDTAVYTQGNALFCTILHRFKFGCHFLQICIFNVFNKTLPISCAILVGVCFSKVETLR